LDEAEEFFLFYLTDGSLMHRQDALEQKNNVVNSWLYIKKIKRLNEALSHLEIIKNNGTN
jgi:hypothetical protein